MVRTQIQFEAGQAELLRQVAARREMSVSAVVREAVDRYLQEGLSGRQAPVARALSVSGAFSSGTGDVSVRHDEHFADAAGGAGPARP